MLEFATTKLGRRFLADVTRIGFALETMAEGRRRDAMAGEGPSVALIASMVEATLPDALIQQLGLLTRVIGIEALGSQVTVTLDCTPVLIPPTHEEDR